MAVSIVLDVTKRLEAKMDLLLNMLVKHIGSESINKMDINEQEKEVLQHSLDNKGVDMRYFNL